MPRHAPLLADPSALLDLSLKTAFLDLVRARKAVRRAGAVTPDFDFAADATLYAIHAGWLRGARATWQIEALIAGATRLTAARRGR